MPDLNTLTLHAYICISLIILLGKLTYTFFKRTGLKLGLNYIFIMLIPAISNKSIIDKSQNLYWFRVHMLSRNQKIDELKQERDQKRKQNLDKQKIRHLSALQDTISERFSDFINKSLLITLIDKENFLIHIFIYGDIKLSFSTAYLHVFSTSSKVFSVFPRTDNKVLSKKQVIKLCRRSLKEQLVLNPLSSAAFENDFKSPLHSDVDHMHNIRQIPSN